MFRGWHCRFPCCPHLVCLLALLLLFVAHGLDLAISPPVHPSSLGFLEKLVQDGLHGLALPLRGGEHQPAGLALVQRQRLFGRVIHVQQAPISAVLFPAQMPSGAQVVADVKRVVVDGPPPSEGQRWVIGDPAHLEVTIKARQPLQRTTGDVAGIQGLQGDHRVVDVAATGEPETVFLWQRIQERR